MAGLALLIAMANLIAVAAKTFASALKAGHYALICNLPGHCAAGQHTDFSVRG